MKKLMNNLAACVGADEVRSVVASLEIDGDKYLLCADAASYQGKWYLYRLGGNIGALLNISSNAGGLTGSNKF